MKYIYCIPYHILRKSRFFKRWYITRIYVLLFCILIIAGFLNASPQECDIWWHLKIGEQIIEEGVWPSLDSYSYVSERQEWVIHSWLADCFFYLIYKYFGFESLIGCRFFSHIFFSFGLAFICYRFHVRLEYCLCVAIVAMLYVWYREIRPFLFSEIALILFYYYLRTTSPSPFFRYVMPITMILWVNIHPISFAFTGYLILIIFIKGINIIYEHYFTVNDKQELSYDRKWYITSFVCIMVSCIHPTPLAVFERFLLAPTYISLDWYSPYILLIQFNDAITPLMVFIIIFQLFIICLYLKSFIIYRIHFRISITEWGFGFLCLVLSLLFYRTMWLILIPFTTALCSIPNHENKKYNQKFRWEIPLILYLFIQILRGQLPSYFYLPEEAMNYWNETGLHGNIYSDWTWSGYIIWASEGSAKTFVDTRMEPFSSTLIQLSLASISDIITNLGKLTTLGTDYLLLPLPKCQESTHFLIEKKLVERISQGDQYILLKINRSKVFNIYINK